MTERNSMDAVTIRDLDRIQEVESEPGHSRLGAAVFGAMALAGAGLAAVLLLRVPHAAPATEDPLAVLAAKSKPAAAAGKKSGMTTGAVTFPAILSDKAQPTTALEGVRSRKEDAPDSQGAAPPPATDKLLVMPLPAQDVLTPSATVGQSKDRLTTLARELSKDEGPETVQPGQAGGFQLQVSSFKDKVEAEAFASALRRRGHRAYIEAADVQDRGVWYRVRIGPFDSKHATMLYRQEFEAKERLVTFVVEPPPKLAPGAAAAH